MTVQTAATYILESSLFSIVQFSQEPFQKKIAKMPWDSVEVGLAGGEETVNFGPRNETGSSLYQVDTLASVSARGEVNSSAYALKNL